MRKKSLLVFVLSILCITEFNYVSAQYTTWYNKAQERIDTLRKGSFGIQIVDKDGQPYTGDFSVRMVKHEFPFGIAFDFYDGYVKMGYSYSTTSTIQADKDAEIYKSERYDKTLSYAIPVEIGKEYKVNLKFAEVYLNGSNGRLFDVTVDGQLFLDNYDVFLQAGGKNKAVDTAMVLTATKSYISIILTASKDNAAIKGIEVDEVDGPNVARINCGGNEITTASGNHFSTEEGFFDPDFTSVATEEQWVKAASYGYFNYGVSGNSFKWSGIQPQHTAPNYTNFENAVKWTQKVGWELRAHTLLWGGGDDHSMPAWVRNLPTPEAITDTCKMRVIREVSRYKGIIKEYDVINEPLHAKVLQDSLVGDSINWNCFKWARSADPDAELYVNDYNVEFNWGDAAKYRDLIKKIKANGAPVTGVGVQAHFWDCCRPNVDELVKNLNIIAEAGLPIRLTEFDYGGTLSQKDQAGDFIKVLTIAFSHPSINGMISWGLCDKGAWREKTGFFDDKHKPKLAADTLLYYTKKKWATNFDTTSTGNPVDFKAYFGTYTIEVNINDTVRVFTVPLLKSNKDSVFVLNLADSYIRGPKLLSTELNGKDVVKLLFDKPIENSTIKKGDFRFFSNYSIGIKSLQVNADKPEELVMTLSKPVTGGDYLSVSYFPGYLEGIDGSKATPFGPKQVKNTVPALNADIFTTDSDEDKGNVYPNPATTTLNIVNENTPYTIEMFNSQGALIHTDYSDSQTFEMSVDSFRRGIYLIRITDNLHRINTKKVILK